MGGNDGGFLNTSTKPPERKCRKQGLEGFTVMSQNHVNYHYLSSGPSKLGIATDSENGPLLLYEYAKPMPMINGPPFLSHYLVEAQEPSKGAPFLESLIGRLPSEIRAMVYTHALRIDPVLDHLKYHYRNVRNFTTSMLARSYACH